MGIITGRNNEIGILRTLILLLAWVTPALIAGALGWTGVWGTGSALGDYLIPIPVAGGVMHVPSFMALVLLVFLTRRDGNTHSHLPWIAFATAVAALSGMLDFDRFNAWLFTDYAPYGSPLRLEGNALYLFIFTDACWAGIYALAVGKRPPLRSWLALPFVALAVVGINALMYRAGGPVFEIGAALPGPGRGEQSRYVYTAQPYDEAKFLAWFEQSSLSGPWQNVNVEHESIIFTNSLQLLKWHWQEGTDQSDERIVATLCLYEDDPATVPHPGRFDCFAKRNTFNESLDEIKARSTTGLGNEVDAWYALVQLCDQVEIPTKPSGYLVRENRCASMRKTFHKTLKGISKKYGADSPQTEFVRSQGGARDLGSD